MIKYNFKVEVPFRDKTNNLKEVKKDAILQVTEERLQELNAAEVGRVISAEYVEEKDAKTPAKTTKGKKNDKTKEPETNPEAEGETNPEAEGETNPEIDGTENKEDK